MPDWWPEVASTGSEGHTISSYHPHPFLLMRPSRKDYRAFLTMHSSLANFKSEAILKSSAPTGTESTLGDSKIPTYVAGNNRERAILFIHDIKGWTNVNSRHLANLYAKEIDCTVYLPDL